MTEYQTIDQPADPFLSEEKAEHLRRTIGAGIHTFALLSENSMLQVAAIQSWLNVLGQESHDETVSLLWQLTNVVRENMHNGFVIPESLPHPVCDCPVDHQKVADEFNEFVAAATVGDNDGVIEIAKRYSGDLVYPFIGGWIVRLADALAGRPTVG